MMFRFPSVICTRCTGFFCLAIIKGPPNDIYCIIEEPYKHYFTEKVSYSHEISLAIDSLNLWVDKTAGEQGLNLELLNAEKEKLK